MSKKIANEPPNYTDGLGLVVYDVQHHFQQYFSYIVPVSFIGVPGKKPATSH
jgi:hypothetical protein